MVMILMSVYIKLTKVLEYSENKNKPANNFEYKLRNEVEVEVQN